MLPRRVSGSACGVNVSNRAEHAIIFRRQREREFLIEIFESPNHRQHVSRPQREGDLSRCSMPSPSPSTAPVRRRTNVELPIHEQR
jgi:hypothetical protein